ncbi:ribonuclease III [Pholiota conissans]|uniref:Ribonuclease III n=1 Tax=Pholiota conissans TaxID=109636 RepID=A0A9P5Z409_9AGAR|nr:ribonuclease III [Pholiota conissans]
MTVTLKPDFGQDGSLFPPLPEIRSAAVRQQVFTHRSFYARPTHVFEDHPSDLSPDNEKYEHLGDTVLGLVITSLLIDMFPGLRVGPSTKIRAMIVGNPTLAEISVKYRLPDRLRLHPAQAITLRASTSIRADVFEAFIGGLYIEQGLEVVKRWINALFAPYALAAYNIARRDHGLPPLPPSFHRALCANPGLPSAAFAVAAAATTRAPHPEPDQLMNMPTIGHLALFNQHLQKTNTKVEWIYSDSEDEDGDVNMEAKPASGKGDKESKANAKGDTDVQMRPGDVLLKGTKATPVWYVKVLVNGEPYGRGRGNTKKAARNEAAKEGLNKLGIVVW